MTQQHPDHMVSLPKGFPVSSGRHEITGIAGSRPPFCIMIADRDGHPLVNFREENGRLVVDGDESRWDEGARRFLYAMMQWSGQVGLRWKDEAVEAGEQ